jgi:hypothetical protein
MTQGSVRPSARHGGTARDKSHNNDKPRSRSAGRRKPTDLERKINSIKVPIAATPIPDRRSSMDADHDINIGPVAKEINGNPDQATIRRMINDTTTGKDWDNALDIIDSDQETRRENRRKRQPAPLTGSSESIWAPPDVKALKAEAEKARVSNTVKKTPATSSKAPKPLAPQPPASVVIKKAAASTSKSSRERLEDPLTVLKDGKNRRLLERGARKGAEFKPQAQKDKAGKK